MIHALALALVAAIRVPAPTILPVDGTYQDVVTVTVANIASGDATYCSLNARPRRSAAQRYRAPFNIETIGVTTVSCQSFTLDGRSPSRVITRTYTINASAPSGGPMTVAGRNILDAQGNVFVPRGVEQILGTGYETPQYHATINPAGGTLENLIDQINQSGSNAVRFLLDAATPLSRKDELIGRAVSYGLVVYLSNSESGNAAHLAWWGTPEVKALVAKYPGNIIIDGLQEPEGAPTVADWVVLAKNHISYLRGQGYEQPITIMAPQYGRDLPSVLTYGAEIVAHDPLHRVIMGWQAYWGNSGWYLTDFGGDAGLANPTSIANGVAVAATKNFPIQVGFDYYADVNDPTEYAAGMTAAEQYGMGWLWWTFWLPSNTTNSLLAATNVGLGLMGGDLDNPSAIFGADVLGRLGAGETMTVAHRTSGVAPLGVFFDAINTVPEGTASPFTWTTGVYQPADYEGALYEWDFGDPGSGTWGAVGTWAGTGNSKNTATGYTAAHVYENPGTYVATLTITPADGVPRTYQQTITVSAFSGTTYYVAANGLDTNPGTEAQPFLTYGKGFMAAEAAAGPVRLLFRRGDTFTTGGETVMGEMNKNGPGIIGAYGTGNRPIIDVTGSGAGIVLNASDWRVMDLHWRGPDVATGNAISFPVSYHTENITIARCKSTGFRVGLGNGDYTPIFANPHDAHIYAQNESIAHENGMYLGGRRFAVMGSYVHDSFSAVDPLRASHALRLWQGHKAVISNNYLSRPGSERHTLKLVGPQYNDGRPETRWVSITDNHFRSLGDWSVAIGPTDAGKDERISHVLFERNRTFSDGFTQVDVFIWARHVMARNNILDGTNAEYYYSAFGVQTRGIEPPPLDVRILNNTIVRWDAGSYSFYVLNVDTTAQDVRFHNNLASVTGAQFPAVVYGTPGPGFAQSNNLLTATPGFTNAAAGDYSLAAGSIAINYGVPRVDVTEDYVRKDRNAADGSIDAGALER